MVWAVPFLSNNELYKMTYPWPADPHSVGLRVEKLNRNTYRNMRTGEVRKQY